jgi:hypothetical protein
MAPRAGDSAAAAAAASFRVGMVRVVSFLVGGLNLAVLLLGLYLIDAVLPSGCGGMLAFAAAPAMAGVRVLAMIGAARAQHATADAIAKRHLHEGDASVAADAVARHEIRVRALLSALVRLDLVGASWVWSTRFSLDCAGFTQARVPIAGAAAV